MEIHFSLQRRRCGSKNMLKSLIPNFSLKNVKPYSARPGASHFCWKAGCNIAIRISLTTWIFHSFLLVPNLNRISKVCSSLKLLVAFQISHFTEKHRFNSFLLEECLKARFLTACFLHGIIWKMGGVSRSVSSWRTLLKQQCFLTSRIMFWTLDTGD